jgi:hypothetical protein
MISLSLLPLLFFIWGKKTRGKEEASNPSAV